MGLRAVPLRAFAFGFSAVSLVLLPVWRDLFSRRGVFFDSGFLANHYQIAAPAQLDYLAGLLVTAALTLILGGALAAWGGRWPKGAACVVACITVGLVLYGLNVVRVWYMPWASFADLRAAANHGPVKFGLAAALALALVGFILHRALRPLLTLVMLGLPMGLVVLFNVAGAVVVLGGNGAGLPAQALAAWIIFDEADYRLLFESPLDGLVLAAFEGLRGQSLDAGWAVSPAGGALPSIPGLITGRPMSAATGARVVVVDSDPVVVGRLWSEASKRGAEVLPLVVDLARPSPALGWLNGEHPSFLARAEGEFHTVLALAILHHLLVTEGIPLRDILALFARLTTRLVVVEYVAPEDANFRRLYRGREELHSGLMEEVFKRACEAHFTILDRLALQSGTRTLFLFQVKDANSA